MELKELLEHFNNGDTLGEDPAVIELMRFYSREAQKITMDINTVYHEPDELAALFSELIGKPVGEGFGLFPPFYTDFGKNITIGNNVFINAGCKFQDQGGIFIDDGALIGHGVLWSTLFVTFVTNFSMRYTALQMEYDIHYRNEDVYGCTSHKQTAQQLYTVPLRYGNCEG